MVSNSYLFCHHYHKIPHIYSRAYCHHFHWHQINYYCLCQIFRLNLFANISPVERYCAKILGHQQYCSVHNLEFMRIGIILYTHKTWSLTMRLLLLDSGTYSFPYTIFNCFHISKRSPMKHSNFPPIGIHQSTKPRKWLAFALQACSWYKYESSWYCCEKKTAVHKHSLSLSVILSTYTLTIIYNLLGVTPLWLSFQLSDIAFKYTFIMSSRNTKKTVIPGCGHPQYYYIYLN